MGGKNIVEGLAAFAGIIRRGVQIGIMHQNQESAYQLGIVALEGDADLLIEDHDVADVVLCHLLFFRIGNHGPDVELLVSQGKGVGIFKFAQVNGHFVVPPIILMLLLPKKPARLLIA